VFGGGGDWEDWKVGCAVTEYTKGRGKITWGDEVPAYIGEHNGEKKGGGGGIGRKRTS